MRDVARGFTTLVGVAASGFLLWLATQFRAETLGDYWAWLGLVAAAGLVIPVSQLVGGWTKWGAPRISPAVLVLAFLPALAAGGLVLLHAQPDGGATGTGWAGDLGLGGLAEDLTAVLPVIAFGLGLAFGLSFDTSGRGSRREDVVEERGAERPGYVGPVPVDRRDADAPLAADRAPDDDGVVRDRGGTRVSARRPDE